MLFILNQTGHSLTWRVGDKSPAIDIIDQPERYDFVHNVFASEAELAYILEHFKNIPFLKDAKSMSWFGDDAKFIAFNLGKIKS